MNKTSKILISILIDTLLLAAVAFSVYMLVTGDLSEARKSFYMIMIVISIPVGFICTFYNVAWDKFDEKEIEEDSDDDVGLEDSDK